MLGLNALRDDPTLFMGIDRLQRMEEIEGQFIPKLKQRTAQEWFEEGLRRKIPIVPVPEIADLIADEEKKARGAIVPIMIGDETGFTAGSMQRLTGTPPRRGGAVPDIGEQMLGSAHDGERCARAGAGAERTKPASARRHPRRRFLDGLGRPDLHADARRSRRRRDQDRGDAVSGLVARRRPAAGLCSRTDVREVGALLHHEPQQARHHARPDAAAGARPRQAAAGRRRSRGRQLFGRGAAEARAGLRGAEQAQSEARHDVDVGVRRRQRAPRLPRLWLDAGAGLRPAERGRRSPMARRS